MHSNNVPFRIESKDPFTKSLIINENASAIQALFFEMAFVRRDMQRGENPYLDRFEETKEGKKINFNIREICEAFFDRYDGHRLADYISANSHKSNELEELACDLKFADEFYTKAFVINLSSGAGGRWEYWQLYIPGYDSEEINSLIPKSLLSKSKHSDNFVPPGYSPLLKKGISKDYYSQLKQILGYKITEQEYFLSKVTMSRNIDSYYKFLKDKKTDNTDKAYLRFMKKWHNPIILIDNNKETEIPIHLETLTLQESYALNSYPIFDEKYPIPDGNTVSKKPTMPTNAGEILQSIYLMAESMLRGDLGVPEF